MLKPVCTICGGPVHQSRNPRGFYKGVVMFRVGFRPWECACCGKQGAVAGEVIAEAQSRRALQGARSRRLLIAV